VRGRIAGYEMIQNNINKSRTKGKRKLCIIGHDSKEFLLVDLAILVKVKLIYHSLPESPSLNFVVS
jgi:hypothetical protein